MNKEEVAIKSDKVFRQMMKQLPINTNSVYFELYLPNGRCTLYVPARNRQDNQRLETEKNAYETLIQYAGY